MVVIFSETFTGSDGSSWPGTWTTSVGSSSVVDIQSNTGRLNPEGANYTYAHAYITSLTEDDFEVEGEVEFASDSEQYAVIFFRTGGAPSSGDYADCYAIEYQPQGGNILLRSNVSSSGTTLVTLSSINFSTNLSQGFRLNVVGTAIKFRWWNTGGSEGGAWLIDTTDSSHASGGFALGHYNGGSATARPIYWDNLVIDDLTVAGGILPMMMHHHGG